MFPRVKIVGVLTGIIVAAMSGSAHAATYLDGAMSKLGCDIPVNSAGTVTNSDVATGLDFTQILGFTTTGGAICGGADYGVAGDVAVGDATGDFSVLSGTFGSIKDLQFNTALPLNGFEFFSAGGLTFNLYTLTVVSQTYNPITRLGTINLEGTGLFTMAGFLDTPGAFVLTANQGRSTFTFSSSQVADAPIPEPGTMLLFGSGLLGCATVARRRFNR